MSSQYDDPIDPKFVHQMNNMAYDLDWQFNGDLKETQPRKTGFVLLAFSFRDPGRVNYISNANRDDVKLALADLLKRWST